MVGSFGGEDCALVVDNACWDDARCQFDTHEGRDVHALCEADNGAASALAHGAFFYTSFACLCLLLLLGK